MQPYLHLNKFVLSLGLNSCLRKESKSEGEKKSQFRKMHVMQKALKDQFRCYYLFRQIE